MPLATNNEALDEFARNAGAIFPEREWLLTDWDVWVHNPRYAGPPGRHPEDDPPPTGRERLLIAAGNVLLDSALRAEERAEREANIAAWTADQAAWAEATKISRAPGCRCSDYQMTQVGCDCGAERGDPPAAPRPPPAAWDDDTVPF